MSTKQDKELKQEVQSLKAFKIHFFFFVIGIALVWGICFILYRPVPSWPLYLSFGWGMILLVHFLAVYKLFSNKNK